MKSVPVGADVPGEAEGAPGRTKVTREDRDGVLDAVLARYERLGATVVSDDQVLCRLLRTLELSEADGDVGEYLCSYLIA
jgi:hypothetical protein